MCPIHSIKPPNQLHVFNLSTFVTLWFSGDFKRRNGVLNNIRIALTTIVPPLVPHGSINYPNFQDVAQNEWPGVCECLRVFPILIDTESVLDACITFFID